MKVVTSGISLLTVLFVGVFIIVVAGKTALYSNNIHTENTLGTRAEGTGATAITVDTQRSASNDPLNAIITLDPAITYQTMLGWEATAYNGHADLPVHGCAGF